MHETDKFIENYYKLTQQSKVKHLISLYELLIKWRIERSEYGNLCSYADDKLIHSIMLILNLVKEDSCSKVI